MRTIQSDNAIADDLLDAATHVEASAIAAWEVDENSYHELMELSDRLRRYARTLLRDSKDLLLQRKAARLIYGFMLDCNAIGLQGAAEKLHRGVKSTTVELGA